MKNVAKEVNKEIDRLIEEKKRDLAIVQKKEEQAKKDLDAANEGMRKATANLDLDGFGEARKKKTDALTALEMYQGKAVQISKQEYISEPESDKVIDSLLDYEGKLAADFRGKLADLVALLTDLQTEYTSRVNEAESVISRWTKEIKPNYRDEGYMRTLPDGTKTNRHEKPWPVHVTPYTGCKESQQLEDYLGKYKRTASETE